MAVLVTALISVGVVCALDLVLTLGVIKRLRDHTEQLAKAAGVGRAPIIDVGEEVGEFSTATVDGERLNREALVDETLVAFFSPTCEPCKAKLPKFREYAAALPGGSRRVLAIVVGDEEESAAFVSDLSPVARVVVETHEGALSTAFKAQAYPTVLTVAPDSTGRVVVRSNRVDLSQAAAVAAG